MYRDQGREIDAKKTKEMISNRNRIFCT